VGGGTFQGDVRPPGLDIRWSVDRLGTCGPGNGSPSVWQLGARACPKLGYEVGLDPASLAILGT
jgi:hypothetical protein